MSLKPPHSEFKMGFTLVEITVSIGTLAVVLGLALAIMQESDHATREIARQQAGAQLCQAALDQAVRTVRAAVAPGNFAHPALAVPVCRKNELSLVIADAAAPGGFSRVTMAAEIDSKTHVPEGMTVRREPLGGGATTSTRTLPLGGEPPPRVHPLIRFAYAGPPSAPGLVDYQNQWTSSGLPALVRITVEARLDGSLSSHPDIELQTALIPGILPQAAPARPAAAATPAPTPKPTATPTPTAAPKPTATPSPTPTPVPKPTATPSPTPTVAPSSTPAPTPAPTATPGASESAKPVKNITAEPPRKVIKPDKLGQVKEARRS